MKFPTPLVRGRLVKRYKRFLADVVLDDGRVLFVSDRTGVAAVWIVEPARQQARQLTNHSARPGRLGAAFVPPPVAWTRQRGSVVEYDAGDARVVLDVDTATAEVL